MNTVKQLPHEKESWNGYSLDELRYMRAYTAARLEINRDRLKRNFANAKNIGPSSSSGLVGKMLGAMTYFDIALLAFRMGSKAFKAMRWIRRKR